ncbi:MAG: glycine--tRNA ligase subunit beta, partial [Arenicellales bacterium]
MKIETRPLLIELGTEELPPKSLKKLANAFSRQILAGLSDAGLLAGNVSSQLFASPRRLAILVNQVAIRQADSVVERRGPAVSAAFDEDGNPSQAATGFARSCKVDIS